MFYKGQIEKINKVVISDPSYREDVWCRYESNKIDSGGPWRVQMAVNEVHDSVDGYDIKGVEFKMLLLNGVANEKNCELKKDGSGFSHPARFEAKEFEIGMDTACVAFGINGVAEEIKASRGAWQPSCALKTLTDGFFGEVYEASFDGKICLLHLSGFLDEDAGYSVEDIVNYISTNFEIKDLELVKDKPALEDEIAKAKGKEAVNKGKTEAPKDIDLEL